MSLETWRDEFYGVGVDNVGDYSSAIEHSIKKWNGLTPENLQKHGCSLDGSSGAIIDDDDECFHIDSDSCALCKLSQYVASHNYNICVNYCEHCPITEVIPNGCDDAYIKYMETSDPTQMIKLLDLTKEAYLS